MSTVHLFWGARTTRPPNGSHWVPRHRNGVMSRDVLRGAVGPRTEGAWLKTRNQRPEKSGAGEMFLGSLKLEALRREPLLSTFCPGAFDLTVSPNPIFRGPLLYKRCSKPLCHSETCLEKLCRQPILGSSAWNLYLKPSSLACLHNSKS